MQGKYKNLLKDTLIFALGSFGSKIILFFLLPLYTNVLTREEYGTSELIYTVSQLLLPFLSLVIFDAVLRYGLKKSVKKEDVLVTSFFVITLGSLISLLISPIFSLYSSVAPWKWYLAFYIIGQMFNLTEFSYLKVVNKNKLYALFSVFQTLMLGLLNILLLLVFKTGIKGYLLSNILANMITAVLIFIVGNFYTAMAKGKVNKALLLDMIAYSSPLIINNVSWWVIQSSDKIMIEYMLSAAALGLYTVAAKIPSLINMIISIFSQAWGVSAIKEMESDNDKDFYSEVFDFYTMICFAAVIFLTAVIKIFMKVYVGKEFYEAWRFVPLLLVAASFSAVSSYFGSMYGALEKSVNNMWTTLISALINISLNYILIQKIGLFGALIGTLVAYLVIANLRMFDVLRFIKFKVDLLKYIACSLIVIIQAVLVGLNYRTNIVSILAILVFAIIQRENIRKVFYRIKNKVGRIQ